MIHANPLPSNRESLKYGGAYISCWIEFPLAEGAEELAKFYIRKQKWKIRSIKEHSLVTRSDYKDRKHLLQYLDEAKKDGASFTFHLYPKKRRKGRTCASS